MTMYSCRQRCEGWHGLINFLRGVPFYALADKCNICNVWFPKYQMINCPCCNVRLRSRRSRYAPGVKKYRDQPKEPIREIIQANLDKGWTLLNEDIWRAVLDYRILNKQV